MYCNTPGKSYALWIAFAKVEFSYVLICDDDNQLFPDYLTCGVDILDKNPIIGALGGKGIMTEKLDLPDWFKRYQSTYAIGPQADKNGPLKKGVGLYGAGCFF
ncbi:glycosyltransferase family A protein [Algoriphagus boritolerans]|uniref:glycosyltransferase family A protein n=1 Tax=Algoriphagus boritolerans TaxID=308111 RepID=UPI002FCE4D75